MKPNVALEIARELLRKFPNAPTRQLMRIAFKENPSVFKDEESARTPIRRLRGASGKAKRGQQEFPASKTKPGERNPKYPPLPKAKTHFTDWEPLSLSGKLTVGILSDIHIPYHDAKALETALKELDKANPNVILLNGDIMDCYAVSRWQNDPRQRDFAGELDATRQLLQHLRQRFPKARIVFKHGNHEERYARFLMEKAPELLGIPECELASLLRFDEYGVEEVKECRPVRLGKLYVIHGHEYRFAISNPVNAARGLFLRAKISAVCGHFHRSSSHTEGSLDSHMTTTFSVGCLCNVRYNYAPINDHNHGFAIVNVSPDGAWEVQNYRIVDGKAYR